ncbi:hypothetical protein ACIPRI_25510 [Variovorax sp. LARHSF232]
MALLDDMLVWSAKELKDWQSDAVRRLFQKVTLDDGDYSDLLLMLKSTKGVPLEAVPKAVPLAAEHLPASGGAGTPIVLEALHSLKHVNRLADDQRLVFLPKGMTVVFGENGAGKSGYSRVIKNACRARLKDEPVLPNAENKDHLKEIPEAIFTVSRGDGISVDIPWKAREAAPDELASVAILDTRCARAYTNQEGELIFAPYGLDIVADLARVVFPRLERAVRDELHGINTADTAFDDLKNGSTAVGAFLRGLSNWTRDETLEQELQFSEENTARLTAVAAALAEKSPADKARELEELATRITTIATSLEGLGEGLTDEALAALREVDQSLQGALQTEALAAEQLRGSEGLLAGTGEGAWRQLFTAAQAFIASHGHSTEAGAPCALCQTTLGEDAASRMRRFATHVAQDASARADDQRHLHEETFSKVRRATVAAHLDETTVAYIEGQAGGWTAEKQRYEAELEGRRAWVLEAGTQTHDWTGSAPTVNARPAAAARRIAADVTNQARTHREAEPGLSREALQKERDELTARQALSQRRDALYDLTKAKRVHYRLSACLEDLKTKPVSDKAGQLAESAVTRQLCEALAKEFEMLGVSHLQTSLKARNEKGRPKLKLLLDLPGGQRPEEILSEGEQRVIAIGSFFAELSVAQHRGAAVFDDPVSSLDHQRRQRVARRLVEEAKVRQTVVFTHDTVFLAELIAIAKAQEVPSLFQHLTYSQRAAGKVNEGLPWRHLGTRDRLDKLEGLARAFAKDEVNLDNEQCGERSRHIYNQLREVVERGVEEVVFAGVLQRYNDYVRVPNISNTTGLTPQECAPIVEVYDKAKDIIAGHDKSSAGGFVPPKAAEVAADIEKLKQALETIRARRSPARSASAPPQFSPAGHLTQPARM